MTPLEKVRVTGFDGGSVPAIKTKEVALMLRTNERIIKYNVGLLNLAEEHWKCRQGLPAYDNERCALLQMFFKARHISGLEAILSFVGALLRKSIDGLSTIEIHSGFLKSETTLGYLKVMAGSQWSEGLAELGV